jgi:hypothetical protein
VPKHVVFFNKTQVLCIKKCCIQTVNKYIVTYCNRMLEYNVHNSNVIKITKNKRGSVHRPFHYSYMFDKIHAAARIQTDYFFHV